MVRTGSHWFSAFEAGFVPHATYTAEGGFVPLSWNLGLVLFRR